MKKTLLAAAVAFAATGAFAAEPAAGTNAPGPLDTSCGTANSCSSSFNVTAQIASKCAQIQAYDIDFGLHFAAPTSAEVTYDQTSKIEVVCNTGVAFSVALDGGVNHTGSGGTSTRRVGNTANTDFMDYEIYQPTGASGQTGATTTQWGGGDGTDAAQGSAYAGTGTGSLQPLVTTGRLHVLQTSAAGDYTDVVTAVMTF